MNIESEEREKRLKKSEQSLRDLWDTVGVSQGAERKEQREYLKNKWQKLPKFDERREYKHPRSSINSKKDAFKKTYNKTL